MTNPTQELIEALDKLISRWDEYEEQRDLVHSYPGPGMEDGLQRNSGTFCKEARPLFDAVQKSLSSIPGEGWRPIESAPKDGTSIILFGKEISADPVVGSWCEPTGCWDTSEGCYEDGPSWSENECDGPTKWQPLPSPPSEEG